MIRRRNPQPPAGLCDPGTPDAPGAPPLPGTGRREDGPAQPGLLRRGAAVFAQNKLALA